MQIVLKNTFDIFGGFSFFSSGNDVAYDHTAVRQKWLRKQRILDLDVKLNPKKKI